jgi:hypothetical protein
MVHCANVGNSRMVTKVNKIHWLMIWMVSDYQKRAVYFAHDGNGRIANISE